MLLQHALMSVVLEMPREEMVLEIAILATKKVLKMSSTYIRHMPRVLLFGKKAMESFRMRNNGDNC